MIRVLVCGGRYYCDEDVFNATMKHLHGKGKRITVIIQGECPNGGADKLAKQWAEAHGIKCLGFPADWKRFGKAAGPIRNQQMIEHGQPDMCVAFPGHAGTADMIRRVMDDRTIILVDIGSNVILTPTSKPTFNFMEYLRSKDNDASGTADNA